MPRQKKEAASGGLSVNPKSAISKQKLTPGGERQMWAHGVVRGPAHSGRLPMNEQKGLQGRSLLDTNPATEVYGPDFLRAPANRRAELARGVEDHLGYEAAIEGMMTDAPASTREQKVMMNWPGTTPEPSPVKSWHDDSIKIVKKDED